MKFVDDPSSRMIARAALSASTASASGVLGRATWVGWMSGLSPTASPSSPKLLVAKLLVIVKSPSGLYNIPSIASFWASVAGQLVVVTGVTGSGVPAAGSMSAASVTSTCVWPANSVTVPNTCTKSPGSTVTGPASKVCRTKMPSDVVRVAGSTDPPVPSVCR